MGTRADFYVGRGESAEWLGSIAFDGYPDGLKNDGVLRSTDEAGFRADVAAFLAERDDATVPSEGWPWPWEDSGTTDYAYALHDGKVWATGGLFWFDPLKDEPEENPNPYGERVVFPNMKHRQLVTYGKRSGLIVIHGGRILDE